MDFRYRFILSILVLISAGLGWIYISFEQDNLSNVHKWSNAIEPIIFDPKRDSAYNLLTGKKLVESADCRSCHKTVYDNWNKSRHRVSYSNSLYQVSHKKEPMAWCLNCHSPLMEAGNDPKDFLGRFQSEDGVSCITCHVRGGKILTSEIPEIKQGIHEYEKVGEMKESEFCGNCHQFNFPTMESLPEKSRLAYSDLPMQNTLGEWKESPYNPRKNCQSCHLFPGKSKSHTFPGGHDEEYLSRSFQLELMPLQGDEFLLRLRGIRIGHHFPTGDLFRSLRIRITKENGEFVDEIILRKFYKPNPRDVSPSEPARFLAEDSSLRNNPEGSQDLLKEIFWKYKGEERVLFYELEMDYQSGENHFFNQLPTELTFKKFLKGKWNLPPKSDIKG